MNSVVAWVEAVAVALALSSIVWVLIVQPIGLMRALPRAEFLVLQMRLVRLWSRALAAITGVVAVAALLRARGGGWPAVAAFLAAAGCARWAIPRALRAGGAAVRAGARDELSAGGFLADGGGEATHLWHRVVLGAMVVVVVGLAWEARAIAHTVPTAHACAHDCAHAHATASHEADEHEHGHAPSADASVPAPRTGAARAQVDRATAENIARLERDAAAVLAAGGTGDVTGLRAAWNRIFAECTTRGPDHDRLHAFLAPIADALDRAETTSGATRRDAVRALVCSLGRFDAGFEAAP